MEAEKNEGLRDAELGNHHVMGKNLEPQGPQPRRHVFSQAAISVFHHFLNIISKIENVDGRNPAPVAFKICKMQNGICFIDILTINSLIGLLNHQYILGVGKPCNSG